MALFWFFLKCSKIFESPWFLSDPVLILRPDRGGNWLGVLLSNNSEMHVISLLSYQIILDFFLIFHDFPDDYSCLFSNVPLGVITYFYMSAHFFTVIKFYGPRLLNMTTGKWFVQVGSTRPPSQQSTNPLWSISCRWPKSSI